MNTEEIKARLQGYSELQREFEAVCERRELLESRAMSAGTSHLDGLPHGTPDSDRTGLLVGQLDELQREAQAILGEMRKLRKELADFIRKIKANGRRGWADRQLVLQCRYIDLLPWPDVCAALFCSRSDFLEREDSYRRRTFRLHADALAELAELSQNNPPSGILKEE